MAGSSYPKTIEERAKLYLHCMVEIKERLRLVQAALAATTGDLFKKEICSLQFRHICELIAIACLAAQGDFKTQRAFREEYSPAKIFNALREIFPAFFPKPSTITYTPGQGGNPAHHHMDFIADKPGAYSEADVVSLWNKSGSDLHRASVKKYLKATFGPPPSLEPVVRHLHGLADLLNTHVIPIGSPDSDVLLDVRMGVDGEETVANFLTLDREKSAITLETYRASIVGR